MNCPRCKTPIGPLASPDAIVTCPGCGTRLMTRSAALKSQGGAQQIPPAGQPAAPPPAAAPALPTFPALDPGTIAAPTLEPDPTPEPDHTPEPRIGTSTAVRVGRHSIGKSSSGGVRAGGRRSDHKGDGVTLEMLLAEIKAVQETQQQILEAIAGRGRDPAQAGADSSAPMRALRRGGDGDGSETPAEGLSTLSPIRAASRKSCILVDDNPQTRQAAVDELEKAGVPVRVFAEGSKALAAIANEKPDVIVLELAVGGDMSGKDLVNMIKATMEWVDIPIVLWTRENVSNQREARQVHGADEVVAKSAGAAALVARVITLFRR
jgi:CheY-like chemotaxis protein